MMTDIKKTDAEELSYLEIVKRNGNIKIPLIQRDYVQGRPSKKVTNIREKFIRDLYNCIITKSRLNLDFVYGSTTYEGRFIPLDGQQRLTTLLLLHLYLDGLRGEQNDKLNFHFTYETRDSSRLFCKNIIDNRYVLFNANALSIRQDGKNQSPSSIIRNQPWWLLKWDADPTIDGMLRMLDTIHSVFFNNWEVAATNLFSEDKLILFQFLKLENFYNPDDLFIKMNARGLPLTDFEIFKGKWMEQIETVYDPAEVKNMKTMIDVSWTDFLWPLRTQRKGLKNIDPFFQNLLKFIIGNSAASLSSKSVDFDVLFEANKKELSFSYGKYAEEYNVAFNKQMLDRIKEELDVMCCENSIFTKFRKNSIKHECWIDISEEWDFFVIKDRDNSNPNYKGRVALYAISRFSKMIPDSNDREINQWTRLIRNLVDNNRFDSSNDAVKAIKDIDAMLLELAEYYNKDNRSSSRVNDWVAQNKSFTPKGFTLSQWEEEKIKAELRKDEIWNTEIWNTEITQAERHPYLDGNIGIILWCSGEIGSEIPFDKNKLKRDIDKFKLYKEKCIKLFDEAGKKDSTVTSEFLLVCAMLTKGDYMPPLSADRRNIYNNPGHRDYSWKALFRIGYSTHIRSLEIIKEVLDDKNFNETNVSESLKTIIKTRRGKDMPLWRRLLTSECGNKILKHSYQGYIAFGDGKDCNSLIYCSSKRSGYNHLLNILYLEHIIKKYRSNVEVEVPWNIGSEENYSIKLNGLVLYYWNETWVGYKNGNKVFSTSTLAELVKFIRNAINIPI